MEENPYARPAGPTPAAPGAPATPPEDQKQNDYSTAVGNNTDYFLPKFESYDNGGSRIGWNWPAFFLTGPYFLYRKMWLAGFLYLFYPSMLLFALGIAVTVARDQTKILVPVFLVLYFASWIVMPLLANSFYWSKINALIRNLPRVVATQPERRQRRLENNGGTNIVVPLIVYAFVLVFFGGIGAAVSIPAYQDYTIRAQVSEGLSLASDAKFAVSEYHLEHKAWPANSTEAGYDGASGKHVESIDIDQGTVIITYGVGAHKSIKGGRLALVPGLRENGDVVWVCGDGPTPDGVTLSEGPRGIEVDEKYLPSACKGSPGS